jgi:two-component system CheB/CheR fusion protein
LAVPEAACAGGGSRPGGVRQGKIVVVDDDPDLGELLELLLSEQGHSVKTAHDGASALKLVAAGAIRPEIIISDYNLPGGMNGLAVLAGLRELLRHPVPGVILTGDISTASLAQIARHDCVQLSKPVVASELLKVVERLLSTGAAPANPARDTGAEAGDAAESVIFVVDDDAEVRRSVREVLEADGCVVKEFADAEAFLAAYAPTPGPGRGACLLIGAGLPGMSGVAMLEQLRGADDPLPTILITGASDVAVAVAAMRAGASDFIEKPVSREALCCTASTARFASRTRSRSNTNRAKRPRSCWQG